MTVTSAPPSLPSHGRQAVFVDTACAELGPMLASRDNLEVIPLQTAAPLAEMAAWAAGRSGYAAIHVLAHGAPGRLFLGPLVLDAASAPRYAAELATLGAALADDGGVLLYGCDLASGPGAAFADLLAGLLGASVAASTTPTGAAALGGDWDLAWRSGAVRAAPLRVDGWHGVLAAPQLLSATAKTRHQTNTLTFDQALDAVNPPPLGVFLAQNIPTPGGYGEGQITINGTDVNIASIGISGNTVLINMNGPFAAGDTLGFSYYDDGAIDDEAAIQNAAGEDSVTAVFNLIVDAAPAGPSVTSIVNAAGNVLVPASATSVDYTVTFSEDVAGVDAADFELSATGTASGTIGAVVSSGNGSTWIVTIDNLSGDGKLGLNLKGADTGIQNIIGAPITGGYTGEAVTLDHTAPAAPAALALAAAADSGVAGDGISNIAIPTITGSAEADATITLLGSDGVTVIGATKADGSGNWSITTVAALAPGSHTLSAIQVDGAGNASPVSSALTFTLDTTAPGNIALSATTVTQAAATSGSTLATLSASDALAVSYGLVAGDGANDADNARFSLSGNALVAAENLLAGTYQIYLAALDAAGNVSNQAFTVTVSDTPAVSGIVRAAGAPATVPASDSAVSWAVTFNQAVTGVDAADFTLATSGSAAASIASVTDSGDGTTYIVSADGIQGDGDLRLDLNASGTGIEAGGVAIAGGYSAGASFQVDRTAPDAPSGATMTSATDTGSSNSDAITANATPTFTGSAAPGATVQLIDSDGITLLGSASANEGGDWSITSSVLAEGGHSVTVKQLDAAGNVSAASSALALTIDTGAAAPSLPVLAGASDSGVQGDGITNAATPTVQGSAEAGATITLLDSDGVTVLGSAMADSKGAWSIISSLLADGKHTLTAVQQDVAGNLSPASPGLALEIDTQAPEAPGAPALDAGSDSGTAGDDVTNVSQPTLAGSAAANASVTLYDSDGTTVLGTTTADGAGNWSIKTSTLALGAHTIGARQVDTAGNQSAAGAALSLTIEAPPPPPPVTPPSGLVDGVQVSQQPVTLPGGGAGTRVTVPIVGTDRVDSGGNAALADIPLATNDGANRLLAQLATGLGLSATGGATAPAGDPLQQLIQAIIGATPGYDDDQQGHLTGNGLTFLEQLSASVPLLVQTIVPVSAASAPGATLTLTGTSNPELHTALVIDTRGLAADAALQLSAVDFAAIVGAADVGAATPGQILSGDQAAQRFTVAGDSASALFAGGGNDTLVLNAAASAPIPASSSAAAAAAAGAPIGAAAALAVPGFAANASILHGGLDADVATFSGAAADYTLERHLSYLTVTSIAQPDQTALVLNAERVDFADSSVAIEHGEAIQAIAGLYRDTLERQADYLGIDFWARAAQDGISLGRIAMDIISSPEAQAQTANDFNGDSAHDVELLYQSIFDRQADSAGLAFWQAALADGATLEQVATDILASDEAALHRLDATRWDFQIG